MKNLENRKIVFVDHKDSEYVRIWNNTHIYSVLDKISAEKVFIRFSSEGWFNFDRQQQNNHCLYWVYPDKALFNYHRRYFLSDFEKENRNKMVYFRSRPLPKKRLLEFELKHPEYYI